MPEYFRNIELKKSLTRNEENSAAIYINQLPDSSKTKEKMFAAHNRKKDIFLETININFKSLQTNGNYSAERKRNDSYW